jgi:hypothetical protein
VGSLRLGFGERLACFGGVSITFQPRLAECDWDSDGPFFEPGWFASRQLALVDPAASTNPVDLDRAVFLALDPDGDYPDPLPVDALVEVTSVFDHPAARDCLMGGMDEAPIEPSLWCRLQFAVTTLRRV